MLLEYPGESIAEGATATLHHYGDGAVLKWYRVGFAAEEAEYEARNARVAFVAGVRTPAVRETITVAGRPGVVFDRVNGFPLLFRMFADKANAINDMALMASLHADLHTRQVMGLPSFRQRLTDKIHAAELPDDLLAFVLARLSELSGKEVHDALCHGDFHPLNILLDNDAPENPVIIDWVDAAYGPPLADVARTVLILRYASIPTTLSPSEFDWLTCERDSLAEAYLNAYYAVRPFDREEAAAWLTIVAAARRHDRIPQSEREKMLEIVEEAKRAI